MAQYAGGKTFTIKRYGLGPELKWWLDKLRPARIFDLTAGSGAVLEFFAAHFGARTQGGTDYFGPDAPLIVGSDLHPAAVCLLRELARLGRGAPEAWTPPTALSEVEYLEFRKLGPVPFKGGSGVLPAYQGTGPGLTPNLPPCRACAAMVAGKPTGSERMPSGGHMCPASNDPIHGFAGFGVSFGANYYSGYGGKSRPKYRDPVGSVAKVYRKAAPLLARVDAWHTGDYRAVYGLPGSGAVYTARPGDLVYMDIPYAGTTGYKGLPPFDHATYWRWVAELAAFGVTVLTSEFTAPAPFERVWYCTRQVESRTGSHGGGKPPVQDGLWVHPTRNLRTPKAG